MFELTINEKVYQFNFGIGFRRELDPKITRKIDGVNGKVENLGVQFAIAGVMDGDFEEIINVLDAANKGCEPRITRKEIEVYLDNPETDIDSLCEKLLGFFESANATKKTVARIQESIAEQKAKKEAEQNEQK